MPKPAQKYLHLLALTLPLLTAVAQQPPQTSAIVPATDPHILLLGRFDATHPDALRFGYPGSGLLLRFRGPSVTLDIDSTSPHSALTVVLDHAEPQLILLHQGPNHVPITAQLDAPHTLAVYKRTETWQGILTLRGIEPGASTLLDPPTPPSRRLLFLGDSVTCGTGVNNNATCKNPPTDPASDAFHSFGMILSRRLDSQVELVCYGGRGVQRDYRGLTAADNVLNAPQFLDLAIPADDPAQRAPWDHRLYMPDAIVVSLGTNDFSLQSTKPLDPTAFVNDYAALLARLRTEYPKTLILATEGAIVTNPLLRQYIQAAVAQLHDSRILWTAAQHYPGNGCDGHPTGAQHLRMADDLEPVLRANLGW